MPPPLANQGTHHLIRQGDPQTSQVICTQCPFPPTTRNLCIQYISNDVLVITQQNLQCDTRARLNDSIQSTFSTRRAKLIHIIQMPWIQFQTPSYSSLGQRRIAISSSTSGQAVHSPVIHSSNWDELISRNEKSSSSPCTSASTWWRQKDRKADNGRVILSHAIPNIRE